MRDQLGRRVAFEGEELIAHRFEWGSVEMVAQTDFDSWRADAERVTCAKRPNAPVWEMHPWRSFRNIIADFLRCYGLLNDERAPLAGEPGPVVEIRSESLLRLHDISQQWQDRYRFDSIEDALFVAGTDQDGSSGRALWFGNGTYIAWELLREGQRVRVLRRSWMESLEPQPELVKVEG